MQTTLFLLWRRTMTYIITVWKKDDLWCAKTPDNDTFRNASLECAVGEIFSRVTVAIQCTPWQMMKMSVEQIGDYMLKNAEKHKVSFAYL